MTDPVGALLQAAANNLMRVAALSFLSGALWAGLAAVVIYLGATRLPPKVAPGRVWAEWRRKRMLWGGALLLAAVATYFSSEQWVRRFALHDLYWLGRLEEIFQIGRLGGACGYMAALLLVVTASLARRRGPRRRALRPPPPRQR